jgi:hypothetical protein
MNEIGLNFIKFIFSQSTLVGAAFLTTLFALVAEKFDYLPARPLNLVNQYYQYIFWGCILAAVYTGIDLAGRISKWLKDRSEWSYDRNKDYFNKIKALPKDEVFIVAVFSDIRAPVLRIPRFPETDALVAKNILESLASGRYRLDDDYYNAAMVHRKKILRKYKRLIETRNKDYKEIMRSTLEIGQS